MYFGGNVLFKTTNHGQSWTQISQDLTTNDKSKQKSSGGPIVTDNTAAEFHCTIITIAPSPLDANVIWVGTDDGNVQVTRDGGKSWTNVDQERPGARAERVDPDRRSVALRRGHGVRRGGPSPGQRLHGVLLQDDGLREDLDAPERRRSEDDRLAARDPRGSEGEDAALRRDRARPVGVVRRRGELDVAPAEHAAGAGARHPDPPARQRPARRHARPRPLRPGRHHAAAAHRRGDEDRGGPVRHPAGDALEHVEQGREPRPGRVEGAEPSRGCDHRLLPESRSEGRRRRHDHGQGRQGRAHAAQRAEDGRREPDDVGLALRRPAPDQSRRRGGGKPVPLRRRPVRDSGRLHRQGPRGRAAT